MKAIEPWQIIRMHTLLSKTGQMAYKIDLIDTFNTDGRYISSSKELYYEEANNIIKYLAGMQSLTPEHVAADRMRKKVISCCREAGMSINGKADMRKIYGWVLKFGHCHKPLNKYTNVELTTLVTQAENMKAGYLKAMSK